jgi:hypothetical protein
MNAGIDNMCPSFSGNTTANTSITSPENENKRHTMVNNGMLSREGGHRRLTVRNSIVLQRRSLEGLLIDSQDPSMRTALFMSRTHNTLAPMIMTTTTLTPNQSSLTPGDLRRLLTKKVQESRRSFNTAPSTRESLSIDPTLFSTLPPEEAELEEDATKKPTERPRRTTSGQRPRKNKNRAPFKAKSTHVDLSLIDIEEQKRMFDSFNGSINVASEEGSSDSPLQNCEEGEEEDEEWGELSYCTEIIEVAPGVEMPLISSDETWEAIMEGRITVTTCCSCTAELTCIDEAHLVVCADCWVFSPVDQAIATTIHQHQHQHRSSVGIGIKTEDIFHWLSQHEDNDPVLGEVQQEE